MAASRFAALQTTDDDDDMGMDLPELFAPKAPENPEKPGLATRLLKDAFQPPKAVIPQVQVPVEAKQTAPLSSSQPQSVAPAISLPRASSPLIPPVKLNKPPLLPSPKGMFDTGKLLPSASSQPLQPSVTRLSQSPLSLTQRLSPAARAAPAQTSFQLPKSPQTQLMPVKVSQTRPHTPAATPVATSDPRSLMRSESPACLDQHKDVFDVLSGASMHPMDPSLMIRQADEWKMRCENALRDARVEITHLNNVMAAKGEQIQFLEVEKKRAITEASNKLRTAMAKMDQINQENVALRSELMTALDENRAVLAQERCMAETCKMECEALVHRFRVASSDCELALERVEENKIVAIKTILHEKVAVERVLAMHKDQLNTRAGELAEARDRIRELEQTALRPSYDQAAVLEDMRKHLASVATCLGLEHLTGKHQEALSAELRSLLTRLEHSDDQLLAARSDADQAKVELLEAKDTIIEKQQAHQAALDEAADRQKRLQEQHEADTAVVEDLTEQVENLQSAIAVFEEQLNSLPQLEARCASLEAEMSTSEDSMAELKRALEKIFAEKATQLQKRVAAEAALGLAVEQSKKLQDGLCIAQQTIIDLQTTLNRTQDDNTAMTDELATLRERSAQLQTQLDSSLARCDTTAERLAEVEAAVKVSGKQVTELEAQRHQDAAKAKELEKATRLLSDALDIEKQKVADKEASKAELAEKLGLAQGRLEAATILDRERLDKLQKLEVQLAEQEGLVQQATRSAFEAKHKHQADMRIGEEKIQTLSSKLKDHDATVAMLKGQLDRAETEKQRAIDQQSQAQRDAAKPELGLADCKATQLDGDAKVQQLARQIKSLQTDKDQLSSANSQLQHDLTESMKKASDLLARLDEAESELALQKVQSEPLYLSTDDNEQLHWELAAAKEELAGIKSAQQFMDGADLEAAVALASSEKLRADGAEDRIQELEDCLKEAQAKASALEAVMEKEKTESESRIAAIRQITFNDAKMVFDKEMAHKENELKKAKLRYEQLLQKPPPTRCKRSITQDRENAREGSQIAIQVTQPSAPLSPKPTQPLAKTGSKKVSGEENPIADSEEEGAEPDGKRRPSAQQGAAKKRKVEAPVLEPVTRGAKTRGRR